MEGERGHRIYSSLSSLQILGCENSRSGEVVEKEIAGMATYLILGAVDWCVN